MNDGFGTVIWCCIIFYLIIFGFFYEGVDKRNVCEKYAVLEAYQKYDIIGCPKKAISDYIVCKETKGKCEYIFYPEGFVTFGKLLDKFIASKPLEKLLNKKKNLTDKDPLGILDDVEEEIPTVESKGKVMNVDGYEVEILTDKDPLGILDNTPQYPEGTIAEDGKGNKLVFRGGLWYEVVPTVKKSGLRLVGVRDSKEDIPTDEEAWGGI